MLRLRIVLALAAFCVHFSAGIAEEAPAPPVSVPPAGALEPAPVTTPAQQPSPSASPTTEAAGPAYCTPPADLGLSEAELARWSPCEKWAWHCVRNGLEANLFVNKCMHPRGEAAEELRKRFRFKPFVDPEKYKDTNALRDDFLIALLTDPTYTRQIKPVGIRIVGAYFADPVNLENVTTSVNLVLDQSIVRKGVRMTNFESTKNVSFDGSSIKGQLRLMRSHIVGSLFMEKAALDIADLNDADIGASFEATGSLFNGELRFNRAKIDGKVILTQSRLTTLMAWGARIGSSLEMRLADIRVGMDLSGSYIEGDVRLQDVTFGRLSAPKTCDWNPRLQYVQGKETRPADLLSSMASTLSEADFEQAWHEVIARQDEQKADEGACTTMDASLQPGIRQNVLLRDMQIRGSLCIMNVTGEIEQDVSRGSTSANIKTISIDGTEAKSTILGWKASTSQTRWAADNYSTEHLLINLNTQPYSHYVDNLKLRVITFMHHMEMDPARPANAPTGEHLVKDGCDITTDHNTIESPSDAQVQERIITFFQNDQSGSAQPFAAIVASLRSSGVNTSRLNKELSVMQNRNACTSSEFAKAYSELSWVTAGRAWESALEKRKPGQSQGSFGYEQAPLMVSDAGCAAWHLIQYHTVRYGHEPLRLILWIGLAVVLFTVLLRFDRKDAVPYLLRRPLGVVYAIDNLIPLKAYRIAPDHADEQPKSRFLRVYRMLHRLMGLFFVIMAFLYIYKAT